MRNKKIKLIIGALLLMLSSVNSFAQGPPGFGGEDPTNVEDTTPISSLVALGVIAGAAYGIRKMRKDK